MIRKLGLILFLLAVVGPLPTKGQDFAPVGTAVAQFLEIGVGARAVSLGEAYTALTEGAGAVFWNPAGLVDGGKLDLYTSYNQWPADLALNGLSLAYNLGSRGTLALHTVFVMSDDMEITTVAQPGGTGESFSITNRSIGLTYARFMTDRVSIGVTGKLVEEHYLDYGYSTWALDLGSLYRTDFRGLKLGMSILHFAPDVRFSGEFIDYSDPKSVDVDSTVTFETYSLPINFRVGTSMNAIQKGPHVVTLAADMVHPNNNIEQYNLGMEYSFNNSFYLRGGYRITADEGGGSLGAGLKLSLGGAPGIFVNYAFSDLGVLTSSHQFTLVLSL